MKPTKLEVLERAFNECFDFRNNTRRKACKSERDTVVRAENSSQPRRISLGFLLTNWRPTETFSELGDGWWV